jgi:hypothetical protein
LAETEIDNVHVLHISIEQKREDDHSGSIAQSNVVTPGNKNTHVKTRKTNVVQEP